MIESFSTGPRSEVQKIKTCGYMDLHCKINVLGYSYNINSGNFWKIKNKGRSIYELHEIKA